MSSAGAAQTPLAGTSKRNQLVAEMESGIATCANTRRRKHGLKPVSVDPRLGRAARFHARNMVKGGFVDHIDRAGRSPWDRVTMFAGKGAFSATSENLAAGQRGSVSVCRGWMQSQPHRGNILSPRYTHVGAGFALGGHYGRYYVMELARIRR